MKRNDLHAKDLLPLHTDSDRNTIGGIADPVVRSFFENFIPMLVQTGTFNEEEAAAYLKTDVQSVRYYALRVKELAYHKVGRSLVFTKKDLDAFLSCKRVMSING